MNYHQVGRVGLSPDVVDGIVFWTKNPLPMIGRLEELSDYTYYFQFTLTSYGQDIEQNLPSKNHELLATFKRLSAIIGSERVIWRYDPVLINAKYTAEYHIRAFEKIASELHGYTQHVTYSFIDTDYRGVKSNIKELALLEFPDEMKFVISSKFAETAQAYGLTIDTCAESLDLTHFGISHARCIDNRLFARLHGLAVGKDKNQRLECGCVASVDLGMYNTCKNGCRYCYANYNRGNVAVNYSNHNPLSPLLSGEVGENDKIYERK